MASAWRCGSLSRSMMSTSKASSIRSSVSPMRTPAPAPAPSPLNSHSPHSRPSLFSLPRDVSIGALGCTQSLMPIYSVVSVTPLTSRISAEARAFCELSQGT